VIASVLTALQNVVGDALGVAVRYTAMPDEAPARFPALVTRWTATLPTAPNFGAANITLSTLAANAKRRTHNVTLYAVISQRRLLADEDKASQESAETLMNAVDANKTLDGACADCSITSIQPDVIVWGDNAFYMIVADMKITELI
jgi:hypothetical protein